MKQKTILCFGDSNTWGYVPGGDGARYKPTDRWPTILEASLNGDTWGPDREFVVVPEGLNGRTTSQEDPFSPGRSGAAVLPIVLESHAPVDLVVIMLGTNDTKNFFQASAGQIALGAELLLDLVRASDVSPAGDAPRVLLVAPPRIGTLSERMSRHFAPEERAQAISAGLAPAYRDLSAEYGAAFFDAATVAKAGSDGVHLDQAAHRALGTSLAEVVIKTIEG